MTEIHYDHVTSHYCTKRAENNMERNRPAVKLTADEPASYSFANLADSVPPVAVVVVEVTSEPAAVVMLVVARLMAVVSAAVVVEGSFSSETWKLALMVLLLSGCTGRKFPKIDDPSSFSSLRRKFI